LFFNYLFCFFLVFLTFLGECFLFFLGEDLTFFAGLGEDGMLFFTVFLTGLDLGLGNAG
jgi:hypothetical protein